MSSRCGTSASPPPRTARSWCAFKRRAWQSATSSAVKRRAVRHGMYTGLLKPKWGVPGFDLAGQVEAVGGAATLARIPPKERKTLAPVVSRFRYRQPFE